MSALASGLRFTKRSKVVLTDWEFPTIGQIWHAQEARGARVSHVAAADDGTIPLERFDHAIDDDTLIVSITHVCYRNGAMVDVPAVVELVLKYLLGSAGLGFFYCRRDLVERVWPTQTGWFADENIFAMDHTDYSPARTAARFQSGTPPVPSIYAGIAGIELMQEIGIAETREHVQTLNARLLDGLDELLAKVVTPRTPEHRGALICVRSTDAKALVAALGAEDIVTSDRDDNLRISAHCYNTPDDVDRVLAALQRQRMLLA